MLNDIFLITTNLESNIIGTNMNDIIVKKTNLNNLKPKDIFCYGYKGKMLTEKITYLIGNDQFSQEVGVFQYISHSGQEVQNEVLILDGVQLAIIKERVKKQYE